MSLGRAIAALRAGRPVRIGGSAYLAVETATEEMLHLLDAERIAPLILSGPRAASLGLGNARDAGDLTHAVQLRRSDWLTPVAARALTDPQQDFARGPIGPLAAEPLQFSEEAEAALDLTRHAGLLPALWRVAADSDIALSPIEVTARAPGVTLVARAALPLDGLPPSQMIAFREEATGDEQVALMIGAFGGKPPLIRLHSECLTGDVFGSLKCDCGPQLKEALRLLGAEGGGILLYLRQEGRGIGLANKLRAYALQDRGLDTVDANNRLGFADDLRDYRAAAAILEALGASSVRLLTNNPAKVRGLEAAGVTVVERVGHAMPANPHNADYLATKRRRSGHLG